MTRSVVVGTAGHIDHGKSALVQALTGTDPDRLKEEKARGITIDLGFAHQVIDGTNFAFVDVPGHERFVKNMLAGVGGIDMVVLVVAADESVMPQTREHFDICRLLRIPAGLVALTKADLVDADMLELARLEVRELVAGSFLDGAPVVPVSAKTGDGFDTLRAALAEVSRTADARGDRGVARLPIDRVFSMKGFGTVITGTLVSGRVAVDDDLLLAPGGRRVKVRGVQVHGEKQRGAAAGQRSAVNLSGVEVDEVHRGQTLVTPGAFEQTRLADATLELLPDAKPLKHGARVRFHQGTAEILGRVAIIGPPAVGGASPLPRTPRLRHARGTPADAGTLALQPGSRGYVRLRLESPAVLARGDRYILRAYSPPITIAGGLILDPKPPRTAIRSAAATERLQQLDFDPSAGDAAGADVRALAAMLDDVGPAGLSLEAIVSRAGVERGLVAARVDALVAARQAVRAGDSIVAAGVFARVTDGVMAALADHHRAQPMSEGIPREELRDQVFARGNAAVFDVALAELAAANRIVVRDRVALATHKLALTPEEDRARTAIERAFRDGGLKPPDAATVAATAGVPPAVADRVLKLLQRQKVLVKIDVLLFHDDALKQLKAEIGAMKTAGGGTVRIDVATFKERFGVTRKFAIPLLEYLDRERVTRRMGETRVVL
jgi:selenocysteine-specific elongation factor